MFTVDKTNVESYQIRSKYGGGVVIVEYIGKTVRVTASGEFGSYGYWWTAPGDDQKMFLISLDQQYAMEKLSNYDIYEQDVDEYPKQVKEQIIDARRQGNLTQEEAREAWDEMLPIMEEYTSAESIRTRLVDHPLFFIVFGDYTGLPYASRMKAEVVGFWDYIWKPFIEELKKEVSNETPTD